MQRKNQAGMGLLDSVIILVLACMVVLILLWISAQNLGIDRFWNLPGWLTSATSKVWIYLTGAASSILLALVRRRSNDPTPNYLLWIFGTATVMLVMVFVVGSTLPTPKTPHDALLMFWLKSDAHDRPLLSFRQILPEPWYDSNTIGPEFDGHYQTSVEFPSQDARFYGHVARVPSQPEGGSQPNSLTEFCFKRSHRLPGNNASPVVQMNCSEGKRCSINDKDDAGWASICSAESDWTGHTARIQLVPTVYAGASQAEPGWKVPSLETLRKMTDRERVGYTEFLIKSSQLSALREVRGFQYLIKVNGSPLYVDGWGPEDMVKPFDAEQGFTFSFGLENLSFSGADNGCEDIEVELLFRQKQRVIKQAVISRKYAALRDADPEEVTSADGTMFTWGGKYVKPKNEDRMELFVLSTPNLQEAKRVKTRVDEAKFSYDGMDIVGVLRPPLDNAQYGIVVGLRQPTEQIRFTYDTVFAQNLLEWIKRQQAQKSSLFRNDTYLRQMRPGASGTGQYKSCSAAALVKP